MNNCIESCGGKKECLSDIKYACNCGAPVVFLCKICVITHLDEPRSHNFISLEQARALKDQEFSENYSKNYSKYFEIKSEIQNYMSRIQDFISQVHTFKLEAIQLVESTCKSKLDILNELYASAYQKNEDIMSKMANFTTFGDDLLLNYESEGIQGLLENHQPFFQIFSKEFQDVMKEVIYFGNENKISRLKQKEIESQQALSDYKLLRYEYEMSKERLRVLEEKPQTVKKRQVIADYKASSRFIFLAKSYTKQLFEYDLLEDSISMYDLNVCLENTFIDPSTCILPTGDIIIADGGPKGHTYKFDLASGLCYRLANLNIPRRYIRLYCKGQYLYAFGGMSASNIASSKAERIKWMKDGWHNLPDMREARYDFGCFSFTNDSRIFIVGGYINSSVEFFNTINSTFESVSIVLPNLGCTVCTYDDKIYMINSKHLRVISKGIQVVDQKDNIMNRTIQCFSNVLSSENKIVFYSHGNSCILIFDIEAKTIAQGRTI